jgi:hypothetical protein
MNGSVTVVVLTALLGCQSSTRLGSECRDLVCPAPAAIGRPPCLVSSVNAEVALGGPLDELCLPRALPSDDAGDTRCELQWALPLAADAQIGVPVHCSEREFLTSTISDFEGRESCTVRHLTAEQRAEGDVAGWYYDNDESHPCGVTGAIRFSDGITPMPGVIASLQCQALEAADEDGQLVAIDADECAAPSTEARAQGVGHACTPALVPDGGFDPRQAYVQTGAAECATGVCLIYHLEGDPSSACDPNSSEVNCPTPQEVHNSVYCSCRCDAPDGAGECDCPDGFSCVDSLQKAADFVNGGYCVRNDGLTH